jgi:hypothetical protein
MTNHTHADLRPFQSIEDTLEFMKLLDTAIEESACELRERRTFASVDRYKNGLTLALYKLDPLSDCVRKSKRILNDLSLILTALMGHSVIEEEHGSSKEAIVATR